MSSQENVGRQGRAAIEMVLQPRPPRAGNDSPPPPAGHDGPPPAGHDDPPPLYQRRQPIIFSPERRRHNRPVVCCLTLLCIILSAGVACAGFGVLAIYVIFHPKFPVVSVNAATLNAGYVHELTVSGGPSSGLALNADLTVLVVISNNNTKLEVELHDMQLDLYFKGHMIGTQALNPPVREERRTYVLQSVHFVTGDVPLPQEDAEAWRNATANGGPVVLHLAGRFSTRLRIGLLRRFSVKVYPHCTLWLLPPPGGLLLESQCRQ